jgi:hypothetical protein
MAGTYRLFVWAPVPEDATSKVRAWGVLPRLRSRCALELVAPRPQVNWTDIVSVDGVFFQRPFMPNQTMLAQAAKSYRVPIVCDWDDDLLCVPTDNPTHANYNNPQSKENVMNLARMADLVTVSTEPLRQTMLKFNPNVHVVPNALDMRIHTRMTDSLPRNPVVMWRGGHTHMRDLMHHTDQIMAAYEAFPDWSFVFMGYNPWWITERMAPTRCRYVPFQPEYVYYMNDLCKMRAAIQIVPLDDSPFNRAKSRIAHIESALAGSVCLAPNWDEWQGGGVVNYASPGDFGKKLQELMGTPIETLGAMNNESWAWVSKNRVLDHTNELRAQLLHRFAGVPLRG